MGLPHHQLQTPQTMNPDLFDPPRFLGGPPTCIEANLPSFKTDKELADFQKRNCGEHATPILAKWTCHKCDRIHACFAGSHTDSNGAFKAGADFIPDEIKIQLQKSDPEQFKAVMERERKIDGGVREWRKNLGPPTKKRKTPIKRA